VPSEECCGEWRLDTGKRWTCLSALRLWGNEFGYIRRSSSPPSTSVYCQSGAPLVFVLVFLQPLLIAILLPERLIIRLLPDSVPPIIKMLSSWGQALSLAILTLNVTRIVAINWGSIGSDIESGAEGAGSSIEGEASQLIGDLQGDFEHFEQVVESELEKALVDSDGVLAQFTMGHQTYATRPIAPTIETSLMVNTEHHLSALNL
jgi:hypothetical protein